MPSIAKQENNIDQVDSNLHKIDKEKALELRIKGLTYPDIAKLFNCSKQAVHQALKGEIPDRNQIESFKKNRADLIAGKGMMVFSHLTDEKIKNESAYYLSKTLETLDKIERLERGQATEIRDFRQYSVDVNEILAEMGKLYQEITGKSGDIIDIKAENIEENEPVGMTSGKE